MGFPRSPKISDLENQLTNLKAIHTKEFTDNFNDNQICRSSVEVEDIDPCGGDEDASPKKTACDDCFEVIEQRRKYYTTKLGIATSQISKLEEVIVDMQHKKTSENPKSQCRGDCLEAKQLKSDLAQLTKTLSEVENKYYCIDTNHNEVVRKLENLKEKNHYLETNNKRSEDINRELLNQVEILKDETRRLSKENTLKTDQSNIASERVKEMDHLLFKQTESSEEIKRKYEETRKLLELEKAKSDRLKEQKEEAERKCAFYNKDRRDKEVALENVTTRLDNELRASRGSVKAHQTVAQLTSSLESAKSEASRLRDRYDNLMNHYTDLKIDTQVREKDTDSISKTSESSKSNDILSTPEPENSLTAIYPLPMASVDESCVNDRLRNLKNKYLTIESLPSNPHSVMSSNESIVSSARSDASGSSWGSLLTSESYRAVPRNNRIRRASTNASFGLSTALNSTLYYSKEQRQVIDGIEEKISNLLQLKHENDLVLQSLLKTTHKSNIVNKNRIADLERENLKIDNKVSDCRLDLKFVRASVGETEKISSF